ncbi:TIGR02680 family protein [Siminovitchia fortis]|uniref:TIGR02680 family protein n=1 Tax=Siminovitchia fortis TaxID=254758 RepID=UPI0011A458AC|nr:TIGR02680 family protein [Siminovitchia fortis]
MSENKWKMNRAGLVNFWYYDDEIFQFADGKLLLRGSNGSGKSVTMQSLIPVLLDGRKSPDRLDPFGSRARKMEDYLLGEKDVTQRDERTGYLFLEYKRQGSEQYVTTGIGLRAKRQKSLDFWGFSITDNRRVGKDFFLYKEEKNGGDYEKIPLTKKELETKIGIGGKVVYTQKEYMDLVNKSIFGFEDLDAYDELIKLIIQLRSPKLSKDFKPTVIYGILESSLPELSDDELRPLSDTIEMMDQTKQQLDQLERDHASLQRLCKQYDNYNQYMLTEKADDYIKAVKALKERTGEKNRLEQMISEFENLLAEGEKEDNRLRQEKEVFTETKRQLEQHEVFQAEEERQKKLKELEQYSKESSQKERSYDQKLAREGELKKKIEDLQLTRDKSEQEMEDWLEELSINAETAGFHKHAINASDFSRLKEETFDFTVWKNEARQYANLIEQILLKWSEHDREKSRYEDASKAHGDADRKLDETIRDENKWEHLFSEEKDRLLQEIITWYENADFMEASNELYQQTSHLIHGLYDSYPYGQIKEPIQKELSAFEQKWKNRELALDFEIKTVEKQKLIKEQELNDWKNKKDPELERHPKTIEARSLLKKQGIDFVPFYKAVEFQGHVSEQMKERIEAALKEAGILDALIAEKGTSSIKHDKVLIPCPVKGKETLKALLQPAFSEETAMLAHEIEDVLSSIEITDEENPAGASVSLSGSYRLSMVKGQAPPLEGPRLIGVLAREQYRLGKIKELELEISQLQEKVSLLASDHQEAVLKQQSARKAFEQFPSDADVQTAHQEYIQAKAKTKMAQLDKQEKNEKMKAAFDQWEVVRSELHALAKDLELEFNSDAYHEAKAEMNAYSNHLQELQLAYGHYKSTKGHIETHQENLQEIVEDLLQLKGEMNSLQHLMEKTQLSLQQLESRLHELGADEIRNEIERVTGKLAYIDERIPELAGELTGAQKDKERAEEDLDACINDISRDEQLAKILKSMLAEEIKLQLTDITVPETAGIDELARIVIKEAGEILRKETRTSVHEKLTRAFFQEQQNLVEYRLTEEIQQFQFESSSEWDSRHLWEKNRRVILKLEFKGQRISPYSALKEVENDIYVQNEVLNERDRELYEEIILNSVGRIIRGRIHRAEHWVKKINHLMENRDPSSGLTFSIRWRPKTADAEEEMDTKDLVDLLRTDPRLLMEADMERVTSHFRSKISRARELAEVEGFGTTLHQVIKDILDYRQWFAFTLYYTREGERKKELTNNDFFKFSGGEKAMAMYIPLFSAAYSRYQEARADAPFVISLDEAFAGVDENNIRDMFQLVEELDFNYIMNSQALWGDYDTVSKLSIAELVRPKNAPYVTVIRYFWNGTEKQLLYDEYEFEQLKV